MEGRICVLSQPVCVGQCLSRPGPASAIRDAASPGALAWDSGQVLGLSLAGLLWTGLLGWAPEVTGLPRGTLGRSPVPRPQGFRTSTQPAVSRQKHTSHLGGVSSGLAQARPLSQCLPAPDKKQGPKDSDLQATWPPEPWFHPRGSLRFPCSPQGAPAEAEVPLWPQHGCAALQLQGV